MSQSTTYQAEFAPPPEPARGRSFAVAAVAHVLLFAALGLVTRWTTQEQVVTAEAELWAQALDTGQPRSGFRPHPGALGATREEALALVDQEGVA